MKKISENNGQFVNKTITNFTEVDANFDLTINCTGLGAKQLCGDYKLVPIRGQIRKVFHLMKT